MEIKCLSLYQPWATLIALGLKKYETRGWATHYRGKIAIHAGKRPMDRDEVCRLLNLIRFQPPQEWNGFQRGKIVAIADLTDCLEMHRKGAFLQNACPPQICIEHQTDLEIAVGYWEPFRWAWKLENVIALPEPISASGRQRLWTPDPELQTALEKVICGV